jgi:hypothetical protein
MMTAFVGVALAYVITASAVFAQDFARVGPYVGGGFAFGVENISGGKASIRGQEVSLSADSSAGLDMRGGYRLLPNIAVEGDLQFFAFDLNAEHSQDNEHFATLDTVTFMANGKAYPLTGRVQPYGLFGFGLLYAASDQEHRHSESQNDAAFALRFGGGIDIYATPKVLINVECTYVLPTSDLHFGDSGQGRGIDLSFIPIVVGAQYRF